VLWDNGGVSLQPVAWRCVKIAKSQIVFNCWYRDRKKRGLSPGIKRQGENQLSCGAVPREGGGKISSVSSRGQGEGRGFPGRW